MVGHEPPECPPFSVPLNLDPDARGWRGGVGSGACNSNFKAISPFGRVFSEGALFGWF